MTPTDTEEASYHRKLSLQMSDPPNRCFTSCFSPWSWTTSHERAERYSPPNGITHILTGPGWTPTQTSHPAGAEVHIKVDYRVDEASATAAANRHTAYYF